MKYQLRLIDQNLPDLARELALACWRVVDVYMPRPAGARLYRALNRAVRRVLRAHVEAYRYCGALGCDEALRSTALSDGRPVRVPEVERVHRYVWDEEVSPSLLVTEMVRDVLRAILQEHPSCRCKGLARLLRRQIERALHNRVYRSHLCGTGPLCRANEAYDAWDLREPGNRVDWGYAI